MSIDTGMLFRGGGKESHRMKEEISKESGLILFPIKRILFLLNEYDYLARLSLSARQLVSTMCYVALDLIWWPQCLLLKFFFLSFHDGHFPSLLFFLFSFLLLFLRIIENNGLLLLLDLLSSCWDEWVLTLEQEEAEEERRSNLRL